MGYLENEVDRVRDTEKNPGVILLPVIVIIQLLGDSGFDELVQGRRC